MTFAEAVVLLYGRALKYHNSNHSYFLGGDRCRSITAIAKILADDYTLNLWRTRQVGRGLTIKRSLCEDIAAAWNDNDKQDEIIKLAIEIAGAEDKARRGTQAHAAAEFDDLYQPIITDQQARDASVWRRTCDMYGLSPDPRWVERIVLYPNHLIAGRFDRLMWYRGRWVLVDIKTGWNAVKYPQATSVQLGLYLNAPLVARDATYDGAVEVVDNWEPFPEDLDRDEAYVILLPTRDDGNDFGAMFAFDMHEGTIAARHAIYARHFQLNASLCKVVDPQPRIARDPERLDNLRREIALLSDEDRAILRTRWNVATMGRLSESMTRSQIDLAEALLDEINPFRQVAEIPTTSWVDKFRPQPPDEGEAVDADTYGEIAARYHRLSDDHKQWIGTLELDARAAHLNFLPSELSTRRRFNILIGLMDLCVHKMADEAMVRAAAKYALDRRDDVDDVPTGALIGALDVERAVTFANVCLGLVEGHIAFIPADQIIQPTEESHAHPSDPADDPQPETAADR